MKICTISDIHGSDLWKEIVRREKDKVDKFIFLGDYMDSRDMDIAPREQLENLQEIIDYKDDYDIDLLIGNHDLQYIGGARSKDYNPALSSIFGDTLFSLIRQQIITATALYGNCLFSHGGVSSVWMKERGIQEILEINLKFITNPLLVDFVSKPNVDGSGDNVYQSPTWIRPDSLFESAINGYHQIVGHTRVAEIGIENNGDCKLIFTDTGLKQYLVIDTEAETEQIIDL